MKLPQKIRYPAHWKKTQRFISSYNEKQSEHEDTVSRKDHEKALACIAELERVAKLLAEAKRIFDAEFNLRTNQGTNVS